MVRRMTDYNKTFKFKDNNECYTTTNEANKLVNWLVDHGIISKTTVVWCPFDTELSAIYRGLIKYVKKIILSNLEQGNDFYRYEPKERYDIIISNPPFSGRTKLMKRIISFDKPFILLQGVQFFNNQTAVSYLCQFSSDFQFLLPRTRMSFMRYDEKTNIILNSRNGASFYSFWICYKAKLPSTFNALQDSGKESEIERYDINGNVIEDNQMSLFNMFGE